MGVYLLVASNYSEKTDYITVDDRAYTHKQIEIRNGITFMRMKKRILKSKDGY